MADLWTERVAGHHDELVRVEHECTKQMDSDRRWKYDAEDQTNQSIRRARRGGKLRTGVILVRAWWWWWWWW